MKFKAISRYFLLPILFSSTACSAESTATLLPATLPIVTVPSPIEVSTAQVSSQGCPPIDSVQLTLKLNSVNQVIVRWEVHGGCAPYRGTLTAWYQDEFEPYAVYTISNPNGQFVDAPILHLGIWDVDYTLEISDGQGHTGRIMQTIGVGRG